MITEGVVNLNANPGVSTGALTRESSEVGADFLAVLMTTLIQSGESQQILPMVNQNLPNGLLSGQDILSTGDQILSGKDHMLGLSDLFVPGIGSSSLISGLGGSAGKEEDSILELLQATGPAIDSSEFAGENNSLSGGKFLESFLGNLYQQTSSIMEDNNPDGKDAIADLLGESLGKALSISAENSAVKSGESQIPFQTLVPTTAEAPRPAMIREDIFLQPLMPGQAMLAATEDSIANSGQNQPSGQVVSLNTLEAADFSVLPEKIPSQPVALEAGETVPAEAGLAEGKKDLASATVQKEDKSTTVDSGKNGLKAVAEVVGGNEKTFSPAVSGKSAGSKDNPQVKNLESLLNDNSEQNFSVRAESPEAGIDSQTESGFTEKGSNPGNVSKLGQHETVVQSTTSFTNLTPKKFPGVVVPQILNAVQEMGNDREKITVIRLNLEPQSLGEIRIKLSYVNGELSAHFHTASGMVKDAIESSLSQLRDNLAQVNVSLGNATTSWGQQQQGQKWQNFKGSSDNQGFLSEGSAGISSQISSLGEQYSQGARESVDLLF